MNRVIQGDCRDVMRSLIAEGVRVQCVVTSPPYWGLRDYGVQPSAWGGEPLCGHEWGDPMRVHKGGPHGNGVLLQGGRAVVDAQASVKDFNAGTFCVHCGAWLGCLGLEPDYRMFVEHMVEIFDLVRDLLTDDGTLWMNMGDSYCSGTSTGRNPTTTEGARVPAGWTNRSQGPRTPAVGAVKPKDLLMMPARVAIALQEAGWWVRQDIIWSKPNPMPESVTDRCTKAHEYVFLLSKSSKYFFDADAIKEPASMNTHARRASNGVGFGHGFDAEARARVRIKMPDGWATHPGDHGSFHRAGRERGSTRKLAEPGSGIKSNSNFDAALAAMVETRNKRSVWTINTQPYPEAHFATFPEALVEPCILAGSRPGDIVFDPFLGSGTVAAVAQRLGRRWLGSELNPTYIPLIDQRTRGTLGLELSA